jgi:hypothetical protein
LYRPTDALEKARQGEVEALDGTILAHEPRVVERYKLTHLKAQTLNPGERFICSRVETRPGSFKLCGSTELNLYSPHLVAQTRTRGVAVASRLNLQTLKAVSLLMGSIEWLKPDAFKLEPGCFQAPGQMHATCTGAPPREDRCPRRRTREDTAARRTPPPTRKQCLKAKFESKV